MQAWRSARGTFHTSLAPVLPISANVNQFRVQDKSLQQPGSQGVGGRPELQSMETADANPRMSLFEKCFKSCFDTVEL